MICGLSGGVDSAVAAVLIHEAIGDRLDLCLRRSRDDAARRAPRRSSSLFRGHYNIPLIAVDASERFLDRARRASRIRRSKRKTIGALFIDVFEEEARKAGGAAGPAEFLAQGTLYPDVIESVSFDGGPVGHHQEPP